MESPIHTDLQSLLNALETASSGTFRLLLMESENQLLLSDTFISVPTSELHLTQRSISMLQSAGYQTVASMILAYPTFDRCLFTGKSQRNEVLLKLESYVRYYISQRSVMQLTEPIPEEHIPEDSEHQSTENANVPMIDERFAQIPIDVLNLSVRTYNTLRRNGIAYIKELLAQAKQLSEIPHMGRKSLDEIQRAIALYLKTDMEFNSEFISVDTTDANASSMELTEQQAAIHIHALNLTVRSYNGLQRAGITTLGELKEHISELEKLKNLGTKSVQEIVFRFQNFLESQPDNVPSTDGSAEQNDNQEQQSPVSDTTDYSEVDAVDFFLDPLWHDSILEWFRLHDVPIQDLHLSVRSLNLLSKTGRTSVAKILELFPSGYLQLRNAGSLSASEIQHAMIHQLETWKSLFIPYCTGLHSKSGSIEYVKAVILRLYQGIRFHGLSFKDFRERISDSISDLSIKRAVGALLAEHVLEYVDFRCYRVYQPFEQFLIHSSLRDHEKQVLVSRLHGNTLDHIAQELGLTRERVRQIQSRSQRNLHIEYQDKTGLDYFDEDYYKYLFEHYDLSKDIWDEIFPESESAYAYLRLYYRNGTKPLDEALQDEHIEVNMKLRIEIYLDRQKLHVNEKNIEKNRAAIENYVLENHCRDTVSFQQFAEMVNHILKENNVPFDETLYYTEDNLKSRSNQISRHKNVLWKQGGKLRYYDFGSYDFTELLDALDIENYHDIMISTYGWTQEMPMLMEKFDIRDEYELHGVLKALIPNGSYHDIKFGRQPMITFGSPDRDKAVFDVICELSPVRQEDLVKVLQNRFGFAESYILFTCLAPFSRYCFNSMYSVDFNTISEERMRTLANALTEDFYYFDEIRSIYLALYPDSEPEDINPRMLKSMGYLVCSNYIVQHYASAEQYFEHVLTERDLYNLKELRQRYNGIVMFNQTAGKLRANRTIFCYAPDEVIHFRRLTKMCVTMEEIQEFCDEAERTANHHSYFTVHMLRERGLTTTLDRLGFDDYFLSEILETDQRFYSQHIFGSIVLYKGERSYAVTKRAFILSLIDSHVSISVDDIIENCLTEYGIQIPDKYEITEAIAGSEMYYDAVMEKVYRDRSYYYAELEEMETEENI